MSILNNVEPIIFFIIVSKLGQQGIDTEWIKDELMSDFLPQAWAFA